MKQTLNFSAGPVFRGLGKLFPVLLILAVGLSQAWADSGGVDELIARGDAVFRMRANLKKARQAAELYSQALEKDPSNFTAAWRLAYACFWEGDRRNDQSAKMAILKEGLTAADKAVAINPEAVEGYLLRGSLRALTMAANKNVLLIPSVKEDLTRAISIDPGYDGGAAYRVLGRMYYILPGLVGGSNDKAIELLQSAVQLGPRHYINHIFLAEAYMKDGRVSEARDLLKKSLAGSPIPDQEPEFADWQTMAKRVLKKLNTTTAENRLPSS